MGKGKEFNILYLQWKIGGVVLKVMRWKEYEIAISRVIFDDPSWIFEELSEYMQVTSVKCWEQVMFATILALKSFERGTKKAKTVKGEILLRLAGTLQIDRAIMKVGVKKGENFLVVFGRDAGRVLQEFLKKSSLREIPFSDCNKEELKMLFEEAAIVDVL